MAGPKHVASYNVETGEGQVNVKQLRESLAQSGEAGVKAANDLGKSFEAATRNIDSANRTLKQGKLDEAIRDYAVLNEGVRRLYGSYAAAPEMVQRAHDQLEQRIHTTQGRIDELSGAVVAAKEKFREHAEGIDVTAEAVAALGEEEQALVADLAGVEAAVDATAGALQVLAEETRATEDAAAEAAVSVDVTAEALAALEKESAKLAGSVREKFGEIPEEIDRIREASDRTFDEQHEDLEKILKTLKEEEAALKKTGDVGERAMRDLATQTKRVETAIDALARESVSSSSLMRDAQIRANRAFEEYEAALKSNSPKIQSQFGSIVLAVKALRDQQEAARREGGVVTDEQNAKVDEYVRRLEGAKVKIREITDELSDQKVELDETGTKWNGIGGLVERMFPSMGPGIAKFGLLAAAVGAAAGAIVGLAKAIGIDLQPTTAIIDDLRGRVGRLWKEVFEGWATFDNRSHEAIAALRLTSDAFAGLAIVEADAGRELDNYKEKAAQLEVIALADARAFAQGEETQKLWNRARAEASGSVDLLTAAVQRLNPIFDAHAKLVAAGKDGEKAWSDLHVTHTTTIEQLRTKLGELGINLSDVEGSLKKVAEEEKNAMAAHEAYLVSLGKTEQTVNDLAKAVEKDATALNTASAARITAAGEVRRLTELQGDYKRQLDEAGGSNAYLEERIKELSAEIDRNRVVLAQKKSEEEAAATALAKHRAELQSNKQVLRDNSDEVSALVRALNQEVGTRRTLTDAQEQQVARLKQLRDGSYDLDEATRVLIDRYIDLLTTKSQLTDASGETIEASLLEQQNVRQELELLGKQIEKKLQAKGASDEAAKAIGHLTEATRAHSSAAGDGGISTIRWSEKAREGKLTGEAAAGVMRDLAEQTRTVARDTEAAATAAGKTADVMPRVKSATEGAVEPTRQLADAQRQLVDPVRKSVEAFQGFPAGLEQTNTQLRIMLGLVTDVRTVVRTLPGDCEAAFVAMEKLSTAGMGGGDVTDVPL